MIERNFQVVIIGGGFSGTILAVQLLRRDPLIGIAVIEKAGQPGRGLAYGTQHLSHLLNVPAGGMSALPEEPDHFVRWAQANYRPEIQAEDFLPRAVYGRYIGSLFAELASKEFAERPEWIKDEAVSVTRNGDHRNGGHRNGEQWEVLLKTGRVLSADAVALATGNLPPASPIISGLQTVNQHTASRNAAKGNLPSAWSRDALDGMRDQGSVLLVGSGLTAVDMIVALDAQGFQGKIHLVSRHGLIPHSHRPQNHRPESHRGTGTWKQFWHGGSARTSPGTIRGLLRLIRNEVKAAAALGVDWRVVIDALRPVTQEIWKSLPHTERRRFLRHVRAYWDIHRHRVAPQIDDVLKRLRAEGRLYVYAGRITNHSDHHSEEPRGVEVRLRLRESGRHQQLLVDRVINCTGSETDCRRVDDRLLKSLFGTGSAGTGLAQPDALFLGLSVNADGFVIDADGVPSESLCAIGPPTKGGLWEAVAVPELRRQAADLAECLQRRFADQCIASHSYPETVYSETDVVTDGGLDVSKNCNGDLTTVSALANVPANPYEAGLRSLIVGEKARIMAGPYDEVTSGESVLVSDDVMRHVAGSSSAEGTGVKT